MRGHAADGFLQALQLQLPSCSPGVLLTSDRLLVEPLVGNFPAFLQVLSPASSALTMEVVSSRPKSSWFSAKGATLGFTPSL